MWDFCLCCAIVVLDSLYQPVPVSVAWSVVVFSHACGLELALSFSPGRWFGMGAQEVSEECRLASFILLKLGSGGVVCACDLFLDPGSAFASRACLAWPCLLGCSSAWYRGHASRL